jgi:hypothetical protein
VLAYAGVLAWACALSPKAAPLTATLGVIGALLLLVVLWRRLLELIATVLLLLGAAYVLGLLSGGHTLDEGAPLVAAGLLACGELTAWSLQQRPHVPAPRPVVLGRAGALALLLAAGAGAAALVVAVAAAPVGSGLAWTLVGAAAAVLAIAVAARLATRS